MKNITIILVISILLLLIFFIWFFLFRSKTIVSTQIYPPALETFFSAKTLHVKIKRTVTEHNGKSYPENDIEIWIDQDKFRMDVISNGKPAHTYISTGGKSVTDFNHLKNIQTTSPADVDFYLAGFQKPPISAKSLGQDKVNNCQMYDFTVNKLYNATGSNYSYYLINKVYCVRENQIVYFKNFGSNSQKSTKVSKDYFKIVSLEFEPKISASVFQKPSLQNIITSDANPKEETNANCSSTSLKATISIPNSWKCKTDVPNSLKAISNKYVLSLGIGGEVPCESCAITPFYSNKLITIQTYYNSVDQTETPYGIFQNIERNSQKVTLNIGLSKNGGEEMSTEGTWVSDMNQFDKNQFINIIESVVFY